MRKALIALALAAVCTQAHATETKVMSIASIPACEAAQEQDQYTPGMLQSGDVFSYDDADELNKKDVGVMEMWRHCIDCVPGASPVYVAKKDWTPKNFRSVK